MSKRIKLRFSLSQAQLYFHGAQVSFCLTTRNNDVLHGTVFYFCLIKLAEPDWTLCFGLTYNLYGSFIGNIIHNSAVYLFFGKTKEIRFIK